MMPLQAGGSRPWRVVQRIREWSLSLAMLVSLVLGGVLGHASMATAQPAGQATDPGFFPATGYRISTPAVLDYFLHRGGVRTFGYPVSNEFPLLGRRVQIFQRQMLEIGADGSVSPATILDPGVLPITNIDGLTLPPADPELLGSAPPPASPDYVATGLSYVNVYVPDDWNGLPVNFQSTFLNTVSCADAFGDDPCDPSLLPTFALEVWGLPTSLPTTDPLNPDFVYQRFQRGILHFSRATGLTQGLLLGDWLKRIMIGVDLSPDVGTDVRRSRFFAQYAPSRPLALDRPEELPDTSLAQAFRADTLAAAGQTQPEPTLPANVAQTATAVAMTATAISATQAALQGTQTNLTATALAGTATAVSGATVGPTSTPPGPAVSNIPVENVGCLGDEQMWFLPMKPTAGVHVTISVTSQRHHDVRVLALTGPLDTQVAVERIGPLGFVWSWIVQPNIEGFYEWTFYADGLRPCITSGFPVGPAFGATPTATETPKPTDTPGPTATPTQQGAPQVTSIEPLSGQCGDTIIIRGNTFGIPQNGATVPPNGNVLVGPRTATVLSWTNTTILIAGVPGGTPVSQAFAITVINSGGSSTSSQRFTVQPPPPPSSTTSC